MLSDEQINKILGEKLANLGAVGGAAGATVGGGGLLGMISGAFGGASGAKAGAKILPIDHITENFGINNQSNVPELIKKYFNNSLINEDNENGTYYAAGIKGSGFSNLNPCILEVVSKPNYIQIFAHAKEGLIKQKTCLKAISALKMYLLGTTEE